VKHISRHKLRKKNPSQTVTATPEKLKGGAVRGQGQAKVCSLGGRRGTEG